MQSKQQRVAYFISSVRRPQHYHINYSAFVVYACSCGVGRWFFIALSGDFFFSPNAFICLYTIRQPCTYCSSSVHKAPRLTPAHPSPLRFPSHLVEAAGKYDGSFYGARHSQAAAIITVGIQEIRSGPATFYRPV